MNKQPGSLEEALLELKDRQDTEVYFEKNFKIKDKKSSVMIPFKINESQRKLKNIVDNWERSGKKETLLLLY